MNIIDPWMSGTLQKYYSKYAVSDIYILHRSVSLKNK